MNNEIRDIKDLLVSAIKESSPIFNSPHIDLQIEVNYEPVYYGGSTTSTPSSQLRPKVKLSIKR